MNRKQTITAKRLVRLMSNIIFPLMDRLQQMACMSGNRELQDSISRLSQKLLDDVIDPAVEALGYISNGFVVELYETTEVPPDRDIYPKLSDEENALGDNKMSGKKPTKVEVVISHEVNRMITSNLGKVQLYIMRPMTEADFLTPSSDAIAVEPEIRPDGTITYMDMRPIRNGGLYYEQD